MKLIYYSFGFALIIILSPCGLNWWHELLLQAAKELILCFFSRFFPNRQSGFFDGLDSSESNQYYSLLISSDSERVIIKDKVIAKVVNWTIIDYAAEHPLLLSQLYCDALELPQSNGRSITLFICTKQ